MQSSTTPDQGRNWKVTKTQENTTHKRAKRSTLSQQEITRLQGTIKTDTNNKKDPQKKHHLRTVRKKLLDKTIQVVIEILDIGLQK